MKTVPMTEPLYQYVMHHCQHPHPILEKVAEETASLPGAAMQIAPDQGALMHMLTKLMGVKRAVELGCFTGYSAISVASALPEDGLLVSFDIDQEILDRASNYAKDAGLDSRTSFRCSPGKEGLESLLEEFGKGSFDMAFLDADKENMSVYFDLCCELVRSNGLIIADNVIWGGSVINSDKQDPSTKAIRKFNELVKNDERVESFMLHISDGLYFLRRR